jgi:hypothetical protein
MAEPTPSWLPQTRDFCRDAGITIVAWGPDLLTVEAKSRERATEISGQLAQLGFNVVPGKDNEDAGLLDLSKNPEAVCSKISIFDSSRRSGEKQIEPLVWAALSIALLLPSSSHYMQRYSARSRLPLAIAMAGLFAWDGIRIWGWAIKLLPEGIHVRRYFRWSTIPWSQICNVESSQTSRRNEETVLVKLASGASERLGTFSVSFARNLRDRLLFEIAQRTYPHSKLPA